MPAVGRIGFWAGLAACTATVAYDIVQILQMVGVLHFPIDEILIFGTSLCIVVPFVFEILAFHYSSPADKRFWTHAALIFTTMYAVFGTANYVIQLTTVIPAKLRGAADTVRLLEQTPHSLFWDFDAVAYIAMGLATLVSIPALSNTGVERRVRMAAMANVVATVLAGIVYFHSTYSYKLLLLGFPWGFTAPLFMFLLGIALRTRDQNGSQVLVPTEG
ncbi:MAG TPA: hypothetical protein VGQ56_01650 [Gemmatimonadaceae bacterium]|jgi:hypothetical protein|nr:hypothetical protein [Gemmatimonadaceae bacterium]